MGVDLDFLEEVGGYRTWEVVFEEHRKSRWLGPAAFLWGKDQDGGGQRPGLVKWSSGAVNGAGQGSAGQEQWGQGSPPAP